MTALQHICCVSLEPWDEVWRRNQHLAHQLAVQKLVDHVTFIEPPQRGGRGRGALVEPGVTVVTPPLHARAGLGGLRLAARWLRRQWVRDVDVLWVNNAPLGVHLLRSDVPAVYDVTDDWRYTRNSARGTRRLVHAEDRLARAAKTIVCSQVLQNRWRQRYDVDAAIVHNGVDLDSYANATPRALAGRPPHFGYVGSLHQERLDVPLLLELAGTTTGTIHLVGPDYLNAASREALNRKSNVRFEGSVAAQEVPSWLIAMDVLLLPHVVTPFTLSLDAIKAYEYLATDVPVVATPTSGFQHLAAAGVAVVPRELFSATVERTITVPSNARGRAVSDWAERAREFATQLILVADASSQQ